MKTFYYLQRLDNPIVWDEFESLVSVEASIYTGNRLIVQHKDNGPNLISISAQNVQERDLLAGLRTANPALRQ